MQYLVVVYDYEDALAKRLEVREAHLEGAKKLIKEGKIINAGALIEDDKMIGSTLYIDFETKDDIDQWLSIEPYVINKVWNMDRFQLMPIKLLPTN